MKKFFENPNFNFNFHSQLEIIANKKHLCTSKIGHLKIKSDGGGSGGEWAWW